jgi:serine/threonine-protein kinase
MPTEWGPEQEVRRPHPELRPPPFDPAPAPAPANDGLGRLLINSVPWSEVSVDGRHIGNTPIVSLQLRAGRHRVTLRTADGQTRTLAVVIHAGQTHRFSIRFD